MNEILNMYKVEIYDGVLSDVDPNKHVFSIYLINQLIILP